MSEENNDLLTIVASLRSENDTLKKNVNDLQVNMRGLIAQLDAAKQMVNEGLASNLQLRTSLIMHQQANQEFVNENTKLKSDNEKIMVQVGKLTQHIQDLSVKPILPDNQQSADAA